ncbi:hypothetical protein IFM89_015387 [Coptis chinensis]|uniref:NPF family transporter n=1 Tax=Coptis chinensis TaxID=261450 RepID=A0A835M088_9MAGN|nr:hypothetical protein IFM89_015387 [Coptis chinensis]
MDGSLTSALKPLINNVHDKDSFKGGWEASMYLIGTEFIERFAMSGMSGNLITYLTNVLHEPTATAAKNLNVFNGVTTLLPLLGAFIADAYLGRFKTILVSLLIYLMGLVMLTLSVSKVPLEIQHVPFFFSLYLVAFGHGGQKPCLQTFGADQFNENTMEEKKAKSAFFNWWYFGICIGASAGMLIVFYVQENVGWEAGFAIPAIAMAMALVIYLLGERSYRQNIPSGSPLTQIMQVFVAATSTIKDDIDASSVTKNNWRLSTVTQVEEVKLLLRLIPIWLSCLMYAVVFAQGGTFFVKQGSTMDTSLGNKFHISPASLQVFIGLTVLIFLPIYDKLFIPTARSFTGYRSGITMLQRIGFGMLLATTSMVVAALVETKRISVASEHGILDQPNTIVPISVWWLIPQYVISGVSNVFAVVGIQELFYDQIPTEIRSIGSAMQLSAFGVGSLLSGVLISVVESVTSATGDKWLVDNLNRAHLDYFYWLLAGLSTLGFCAFIGVSKSFVYKKVDGDC